MKTLNLDLINQENLATNFTQKEQKTTQLKPRKAISTKLIGTLAALAVSIILMILGGIFFYFGIATLVLTPIVLYIQPIFQMDFTFDSDDEFLNQIIDDLN